MVAILILHLVFIAGNNFPFSRFPFFSIGLWPHPRKLLLGLASERVKSANETRRTHLCLAEILLKVPLSSSPWGLNSKIKYGHRKGQVRECGFFLWYFVPGSKYNGTSPFLFPREQLFVIQFVHAGNLFASFPPLYILNAFNLRMNVLYTKRSNHIGLTEGV